MCQSVAAAAGHDTQCRGRVDESAGHLVDGAVAPHGHHDLRSLCRRLACQFLGMSRTLCVADGIASLLEVVG